MSYSVGDIVPDWELDTLPNGTVFKNVKGEFEITEIPSQTAQDLLAARLRDELELDWQDAEDVAEWVLANFSSDGPLIVVDRMGDRWHREADGTYSFNKDGCAIGKMTITNWPIEKLRREYGPLSG